MAEEHLESKRSTGRSPAYPFIPLEKALKRAETLRKAVGKSDTRVVSAMHHWKYGPKSSGGIQTVAALKHFGLLDDFGSGQDRRVKLTDLAHRILLDERPDSTERDMLIQQAALNPKMHQELWSRWGRELPVDAEMRHYLILDRDFNENGADDFIQEYKATLSYSGLLDSDTMPYDAADIESAPAHDIGGQMQQPTSEPRTAPLASPMALAPSGEASLVLYNNRIQINADVDIKGAKDLMRKLQKRIELLEEEQGQQ